MRNCTGGPKNFTQKMIGPKTRLDTHHQTQKLPQKNEWGETSYKTENVWAHLVEKPEN
jgi:hypothetical protein